jgi:hypothetical protein
MSTALAELGKVLPPATQEALEKILKAEEIIGSKPQIDFQTEHILHGGMYSRTVRLAKDVIIVGVEIKVPTTVIVNGDTLVFAGDKWYRLQGYQVMAASAGRKQIFWTIGATEITMMFSTKAKTVDEAEREFTDEIDKLVSRKHGEDDIVVITGE